MNKYVCCIGKIKKEDSIINNDLQSNEINISSHKKRVTIVSLKMVKEGSILYKDRTIHSPCDAANLVRNFIQDNDRENIVLCCLDVKNQPTSIQTVSIGSLNSAIVHPREIFKLAILSNAASIIITHNHPSGNITPSNEDISITQRIKEAGKIIGIDLIDHIIIGAEDSFCSLKEKGII